MLNLSAPCTELTAALADISEYDATVAPGRIWVGTILCASGGFEQTNVSFFEVIERKGDWVKVVSIGKTQASDGPQSMTGTAVPDRSKRSTKAYRRKVHAGYAGGEFIFPDGQYSMAPIATPWDGAPKRFSTYA